MPQTVPKEYLEWELKIIEHYGTQEAFANLFDPPLAASTIRYWKQKGIPPRRVFKIERVTEYKITRHDMRPDLWPEPSTQE